MSADSDMPVARPAGFPDTDKAEIDAINIFESSIDTKYVKTDIKRRDKHPNSDGAIEIVDDARKPLGKLEVQVRKIPDGATSYSCAMSLVAYSDIISTPFLLICVDVANKKAYYRHIHKQMVPDDCVHQQSFTIKFDEKIHLVSPETGYIGNWLSIAQAYSRLVSTIPKYSDLVTITDLSKVSLEDRIYFQDYVEQINRLLDLELPIVKHHFFKGVWKIGAAVNPTDKDRVQFQHYSIAPGGLDIRVTGLVDDTPQKPWNPNSANTVTIKLSPSPQGTSFQFNFSLRAGLKSAKEEAGIFVFGRLSKLLKEKRLSLFGQSLATEYLFWYVDNFGSSLGIEPADKLSVPELNYGVYVYFQAWASLAMPRFRGELFKMNAHAPQQAAEMVAFAPVEDAARLSSLGPMTTKTEVINFINSGEKILPQTIRFSEASPDLLADAIDYLSGSGTDTIKRLYLPRVRAPKMIWGSYTADAIRHNVKKILLGVPEEYKIIAQRNQLPLKNSRYLHGSDAIVYIADIEKWVPDDSFQNAPFLKEYTLKNADGKLPKISFYDASQTKILVSPDKKAVELDGLIREVISGNEYDAAWLFQDLALLNLIYDMLKKDLTEQYKYDFLR